MNDKIEFDYQRAGALLTIVQLVAGVAPGFTSISSEAMAELREMNDKLGVLARERAEAIKAEAAARAAEEAENANAEGDEVQPENPALDPNPQPTPPIDHTKTAESKPNIRRTI
jgi:hypothetical protein